MRIYHRRSEETLVQFAGHKLIDRYTFQGQQIKKSESKEFYLPEGF